MAEAPGAGAELGAHALRIQRVQSNKPVDASSQVSSYSRRLTPSLPAGAGDRLLDGYSFVETATPFVTLSGPANQPDTCGASLANA